VFCGIGRQNGDDIVPVAVWGAEPNTDYEVAPVEKYFISTGNYMEGDSVGVSSLGAVATIDFTGTHHTVATTTLKQDGTYTDLTYSD
jgi:hypothetical protein